MQPFILDAMFDKRPSPFFTAFVKWIRAIIVLLTPIATAIYFAQKFGDVLKSAARP